VILVKPRNGAWFMPNERATRLGTG